MNSLFEGQGIVLWYSAILLLKLATFPPLVGINRVLKGVFVSQEDVVAFPYGKIKFDDETIERIRRALLNDMENIIPFLGLIFLYGLGVQPAAGELLLLCRTFTAARVAHTISYLLFKAQPYRFLAFVVGVGCNVYMAIQIIMKLL